MSDDRKFKPKPLSKASLEAPMEARWKVMGPEEAKRLHQLAQSEHHRFNPCGPRLRTRFLKVSIGTAVSFVLLGLLLISWSWRVIPTFGLAGFLLGAVVAIFRPYDFLAGLLYGLACLIAGFWQGAHLVLLVPAAFLVACLGIEMGRVEQGKVFDGE